MQNRRKKITFIPLIENLEKHEMKSSVSKRKKNYYIYDKKINGIRRAVFFYKQISKLGI